MAMPTVRKNTVFSIEQAAGEAPHLAALQKRISASLRCLELASPLIPAPLRKQVQAGPYGEGEWCILVSGSAASTKLRHLLPAIQQRLTENGAQVNSIRLKIQSSQRGTP
ncbi:hypothetical protein [Hydrogenophaga sp.]|uniref:hypothetical protein n=1 Tax=Hydrogenophaga sp. TaxID=1904254 RepID=UPI0035B0F845